MAVLDFLLDAQPFTKYLTDNYYVSAIFVKNVILVGSLKIQLLFHEGFLKC